MTGVQTCALPIYSQEIMYLYDVLSTNFPESRTLWDLHHYFAVNGTEFDIQFDISFIQNFQIKPLLPSYRASDFNNHIPAAALNILSKSTYRLDVGENWAICKLVKIPVYIVFCTHPIGSKIYRPPFLRVYMLEETGEYSIQETNKFVCVEGEAEEKWNLKEIVDTSKYLPFRVGLMELKNRYFPDHPIYRMILIDSSKNRVFQSSREASKMRVDQEQARADQEQARADQEKARADQEKARADQEKARADQEKARLAQEIQKSKGYEQLIEKYKQKFGDLT